MVQFSGVRSVHRRLDKAGVLKHIVLAGSWCTLFYKSFFAGIKYVPVLKTRDYYCPVELN